MVRAESFLLNGHCATIEALCIAILLPPAAEDAKIDKGPSDRRMVRVENLLQSFKCLFAEGLCLAITFQRTVQCCQIVRAGRNLRMARAECFVVDPQGVL